MRGWHPHKVTKNSVIVKTSVTSSIKTFWLTACITNVHQRVYNIALNIGMRHSHYIENVNTKLTVQSETLHTVMIEMEQISCVLCISICNTDEVSHRLNEPC